MLHGCLLAESAKNISWPCLSPLRKWGSLTYIFIYIIYIYISGIYYILCTLNILHILYMNISIYMSVCVCVCVYVCVCVCVFVWLCV